MKQKDIAIIIIITFIAGIFSFFIANYFFGGDKAYKLTAPTVDVITAEFTQPDPTYFNSNSVNPTRDITIGGSTNTAPFNGSSQ